MTADRTEAGTPAGLPFGLPSADRLPHAVILEGAGAEEAAALLAATLVCEQGDHCGQCAQCRMLLSGAHSDILHVHPEKATMGVDTVRRVRQDVYIRPNQATHKVYVLHRADVLTEQAQNALLKILEEPPEYARFVLLCDNAARLLPTVRSRAARFGTRAAGEESAKIGAASLALLTTLCAGDRYGLAASAVAIERDRPALTAVLNELSAAFVAAAGYKTGHQAVVPPIAEQLANTFTLERLLAMSEQTGRLLNMAERNVGGPLIGTLLALEL